MLIICGGMPKAGSSLLMRHAIQLLELVHGRAGQEAFEAWVREGPVGGVGCFPLNGWENHWETLQTIARQHGPFVLKTHYPYPWIADSIKQDSECQLLYTYRDPRDVVLSALDHGARSREKGETHFADCVDLGSAIFSVQHWCREAMEWLEDPKVYRCSYHEMLTDPVQTISRLACHFGMAPAGELAERSIAIEETNRAPGRDQFRIGKVSRWREEMSRKQKQSCQRAFASWLPILAPRPASRFRSLISSFGIHPHQVRSGDNS